MDGSDHWMRLAGREYLRVSEDDRTPLPFIREAAVMAAKCFLSVENLHVASKGLRRAQAIETALSADADLMAAVPDIPFRHAEPFLPQDASAGAGGTAQPPIAASAPSGPRSAMTSPEVVIADPVAAGGDVAENAAAAPARRRGAFRILHARLAGDHVT